MKLVTVRFRKKVVAYKDFSAVVTQDEIADGDVLAGEPISKNRNPHGAKLLRTDLLCGICCCGFGLLYEKFRLDKGEKVVEFWNEERKGCLDLDANALAGSHNWDHSFCFMCEDIISVS